MKIEVASRVRQVEEYYFSRKLKEIAAMKASGLDVINLGIGSPDKSPSPQVIERLCREASRSNVHGYQSYAGIPELRNAFASWFGEQFQVELNPASEVLPLIGSKEGIMHVAMTYLEAGDEVLVPDPGYPTYRSASVLTGATVRDYELREDQGWWPDLEALQQTDLSKVKLMWVNYPHMPTGAKPPQGGFAELVAFARKNHILICHDNPYAFILNDSPESMLSVPGAKDVVVELHSLSKTFNMAGWRVGFLAGNADRISEIIRFKSNMDSGMFRPLQLAAVEALSLSSQWYEEINRVYRVRRKLAESLLNELGCMVDPNQAGMFVWARIPTHYDNGFEMADSILQNAHVFITPGNIFGSQGNKYVRLSLCSPKDVYEEAIVRCKRLTKSPSQS